MKILLSWTLIDIMLFFVPLVCFVFTCTFCQHLSVQLSNVSHLSVAEERLFASSGWSVYTFSSNDLAHLQSELLGSEVVGLGSTADGRWCVVCMQNGTCSVLDGLNIQLPPKRLVDAFKPGFHNELDESLTLLVAYGFMNATSFLTGSYISSSGKRIRYGQFELGSSAAPGKTSTAIPSSDFQGRHYHGGFVYMKYAYYIVVDSTNSVFKEIRIVRLCLEGSLNSQIELVLDCQQGNFLEIFVNSVSILEDSSLLILGTDFMNGAQDKVNKVCFYNLTEINAQMDQAYHVCVISGEGTFNVRWIDSRSQDCSSDLKLNSDGSPSLCDFKVQDYPIAIANEEPLPSISLSFEVCGLTAVTAMSIEEIDIMFAAFKNCTNGLYYVNKYHLTKNNSVVMISSINVDSEVKLLTRHDLSDPEYIFAVTSSKIMAFKANDCADWLNCDDCITKGDALCGWCLLEGRCSLMTVCSDVFLTDEESCFNNITFKPSMFTTELQTPPYKIHVSLDSPIPLWADEWVCVFNVTEQINYLIMQAPFNGSYCFVNEIVDKVNSSLKTKFTLYNNRTSTHVYHIAEEYIFFTCKYFTKCTSCVEAPGKCGWCALDFICTANGNSCTGGMEMWLTYPVAENNGVSAKCPLLIGSKYSVPAGVEMNLNLMTLNTWMHFTGLKYVCNIGEAYIQGEVVNSSTVQCRIGSNELLLTMHSNGVETWPLGLIQIYNGKEYNVEVRGQITLRIYDCLVLAGGGCSECLSVNINTGYECGWCNDLAQCRVKTQCQTPLVLKSGGCNRPAIISFNPATALAGEMVNLKIIGTNLGVEFSDILRITLGSHVCIANETSYKAGKFIECFLDSSQGSYGEEYIHVVINTTAGKKTARSEVMFVFLEPSIDSVFPSFGPASGGTLVVIRGNNLDIGGEARTAVLMRNHSRKLEFQCTIFELNSTAIYCQTRTAPCSSCSMQYAIAINNIYFNFSHEFLYKPDPIFSFLVTKGTIMEGGIRLKFEGIYLNSVSSPSIRINDTRFKPTEEGCTSAADGLTMSCIAPPIIPYTNSTTVPIYTIIGYSVRVDWASEPDHTMLHAFALVLIKTPVIKGVSWLNQTGQGRTTGGIIQVEGNYIESVATSEITVYVGEDECALVSITDEEILCRPPVIHNESVTFKKVKVLIGLNLVFTGPEWFIMYLSTSDSLSDDHTLNIVLGTIVPLIALIAVFGSAGVLLIYCHYRQKKRKLKAATVLFKEDRAHIYSSIRRKNNDLPMNEKKQTEATKSDCYESRYDAMTEMNSTTLAAKHTAVSNPSQPGEGYEVMRSCYRVMPADEDSTGTASGDED